MHKIALIPAETHKRDLSKGANRAEGMANTKTHGYTALHVRFPFA